MPKHKLFWSEECQGTLPSKQETTERILKMDHYSLDTFTEENMKEWMQPHKYSL